MTKLTSILILMLFWTSLFSKDKILIIAKMPGCLGCYATLNSVLSEKKYNKYDVEIVSLNNDREAILKCKELFPGFNFVPNNDSISILYNFAELFNGATSNFPCLVFINQQIPHLISNNELFQSKTVIDIAWLRKQLPSLIGKFVVH